MTKRTEKWPVIGSSSGDDNRPSGRLVLLTDKTKKKQEV